MSEQAYETNKNSIMQNNIEKDLQIHTLARKVNELKKEIRHMRLVSITPRSNTSLAIAQH